VHPLRTNYKSYIEEELRCWQEDLKDGREAKKWRMEAMQAGKDREDGKFEKWIEREREEYWGPREKVEVEGPMHFTREVSGEGEGDVSEDEEDGVEG